jgi:NAD(P)-dependent dehydrogenase (short-subunit alcohol dehydrogenase family)
MGKRLEGKVCIITGATSGMGRDSAVLFGEEGAKLILAGRREEKGSEVVEIIRKKGGEATFVKTDMTVDSQVDNLVQRTVDMYGRIDVLFGNAGIPSHGKFEEFDMQKDYEDIFRINTRSDIYITKKVIPCMIKQKKGSVIYTTSNAAWQGAIYLSAYCASKGAVKMLSKTLAMEYAPLNIRFNTIQPGCILSEMSTPEGPVAEHIIPMTPMGRAGTGREVGYLALFLASDESSYITGTDISIDGGFSAGCNVRF